MTQVIEQHEARVLNIRRRSAARRLRRVHSYLHTGTKMNILHAGEWLHMAEVVAIESKDEQTIAQVDRIRSMVVQSLWS